jgi:TonB family protein
MVRKVLYIFVLCFCANTLFAQNDSIEYIGISIAEDMPVFNGGINDFIQANIKYPQSAKNDSIQGRVFISFWVDTSGITTEHEVAKGVREDLDKEALRVAKLIKFEKPAMQRGKPVKIQYTVPVEFSLKESSNNKRKKKCDK